MDDLISRQAAIDIKFSCGLNEDGILYVPYHEVIKHIKSLPSAQQEDCDTCRYGHFGDRKCDYCRGAYPSHYERCDDE